MLATIYKTQIKCMKLLFFFFFMLTFIFFFGKLVYDLIFPYKLMNDDIFNKLKIEYFVLRKNRIDMKIRLPRHIPYNVNIENIRVVVLDKEKNIVAELKAPPVNFAYSNVVSLSTEDIKLTIYQIFPTSNIHIKFACSFSVNYLLRPTKLPFSFIYHPPIVNRINPAEISLHNLDLGRDHMNIQVKMIINMLRPILPTEIEIYNYKFDICLNGRRMNGEMNYYGNKIYNLKIFFNENIENLTKHLIREGVEHFMLDNMPLFTEPVIIYDLSEDFTDIKKYLNLEQERVSVNQVYLYSQYGEHKANNMLFLNINNQYFHISADVYFIFKMGDINFGISIIFSLYDLENLLIDFTRTYSITLRETNFNLEFIFDLSNGIYFNECLIYNYNEYVSVTLPVFHHSVDQSADGISVKTTIIKKNMQQRMSNINIIFKDILFSFSSEYYTGRFIINGRIGLLSDLEITILSNIFFSEEFFIDEIKLKNHCRFQFLENEVDIIRLVDALPNTTSEKNIVFIDSFNFDEIIISFNLPFLERHSIDMVNEQPIIFRLRHNHHCQFIFSNFTLTIRNTNILFETAHYIFNLDQPDVLSKVVWQLLVEAVSFLYDYIMEGEFVDFLFNFRQYNMNAHFNITGMPFIPVSLQLDHIDYLNIRIFFSGFSNYKITWQKIYESEIKSSNILIKFKGGGVVEIPLSFLFSFFPKINEKKKSKFFFDGKNLSYEFKDNTLFLKYDYPKIPYDFSFTFKGEVFKRLKLNRTIVISGREGKYFLLKIPITQSIIDFGGDFIVFYIIEFINSGWKHLIKPNFFAAARNYINEYSFFKIMNIWHRKPLKEKQIFAINFKTNSFLFLFKLPVKNFKSQEIYFIKFFFIQIRVITVPDSPYVAVEIINTDTYSKIPRFKYKNMVYQYNTVIYEEFIRIYRVLIINKLLSDYKSRILIFKYFTHLLLIYLNKIGIPISYYPLRDFIFS